MITHYVINGRYINVGHICISSFLLNSSSKNTFNKPLDDTLLCKISFLSLEYIVFKKTKNACSSFEYFLVFGYCDPTFTRTLS